MGASVSMDKCLVCTCHLQKFFFHFLVCLFFQQEEERAKKETTSPTKLPVVIEAQEPSEEAKLEANKEKVEGQEPAETKVY